MKKLIILTLFFLGNITYAAAEDLVPKLPEPLQNLAAEGAQMRYLGKEHDLDGWVAIKNGQEQYFYVKPDGKAFVMGVLFDGNGDLVTVEQVRKLRESEGEALDILTKDTLFTAAEKKQANNNDLKDLPASERLFADLESSNWIGLGNPDAPVLYSFVDPQCGHCHAFIQETRNLGLIENDKLQIRAIPVGFRQDTAAQAAFLIAAPDGQKRFYNHLDGDVNALPIKTDINLDGAMRNVAIMQSWNLDVTPISAYRAKDGSIKIIRGKPQDIQSVVNDLKR